VCDYPEKVAAVNAPALDIRQLGVSVVQGCTPERSWPKELDPNCAYHYLPSGLESKSARDRDDEAERLYLGRWCSFDWGPLIDEVFAGAADDQKLCALGELLKLILCPVNLSDIPTMQQLLNHPVLAAAVAEARAQQDSNRAGFQVDRHAAYYAGVEVQGILSSVHAYLAAKYGPARAGGWNFENQLNVAGMRYSKANREGGPEAGAVHIPVSDQVKDASVSSWSIATAASATRGGTGSCPPIVEGLTRSSNPISEVMRHRSSKAAPSSASSAASSASSTALTDKTEQQPGATAAGKPVPLEQRSQLLLQVSSQQPQVPNTVSNTASQKGQPQHVTATAAATAAAPAAEQPLCSSSAADMKGSKAAGTQQQRKPGQQAVLHLSGAMRHCDLEQLLLDKADTDYAATAAGSTDAVTVAAGCCSSSSVKLPSPVISASAASGHSSSSTATTQQPAVLHPSGVMFAAALDQLLLDKADADYAAAMAAGAPTAAVAGCSSISSCPFSRSPVKLPQAAAPLALRVGDTSSSIAAPQQQTVLHPPGAMWLSDLEQLLFGEAYTYAGAMAAAAAFTPVWCGDLEAQLWAAVAAVEAAAQVPMLPAAVAAATAAAAAPLFITCRCCRSRIRSWSNGCCPSTISNSSRRRQCQVLHHRLPAPLLPTAAAAAAVQAGSPRTLLQSNLQLLITVAASGRCDRASSSNSSSRNCCPV